MYLVPQDEIEIRDLELDLVLHLRLGRQIMMIVQDTEPPQVGNLQVGRKVTRIVEPPEVGHLQVGRQVTQGADVPNREFASLRVTSLRVCELPSCHDISSNFETRKLGNSETRKLGNSETQNSETRKKMKSMKSMKSMLQRPRNMVRDALEGHETHQIGQDEV
jgi:hypothetical protein